MNANLIIILLFSTLLIFVLPVKVRYYFTLLILVSAIVLTTIWSFAVLNGSAQTLIISSGSGFLSNAPALYIDRLSAFFILIINFTLFTGFLYAKGYLRPYLSGKSEFSFTLHYFSYIWLYFSMLLVVMLRDGFAFLIAWEIMSLSSFLLVIFDAEDRTILKTGINYLIQMHVGMAFILIAFIVAGIDTGNISFFSLTQYFSTHSNILLFLLFFIGFGIKAGFIPLHTWLPEAHPAAPSHVSGVMSGVMIKMGIYGILRVLESVQSDLLVIGIIILAISVVSGLLGVMMAIVQHDLKRLLAYHSIENIGIIGMGIGLGVIGMATENTTLVILAFSGGILHVLNHSLFKSLLFFSAGSVYQSTHTRNIEQLGGLIKKMPYTSVFFLIGSLAICGLPPFNGFISEYLIFSGMFKTVAGASLFQSIVIICSIIGLVLIGGLAVFCFTKAFGIVFLGQSRSQKTDHAAEVAGSMLLPQILIVFLIIGIGLGSAFFVKPVMGLVAELFKITDYTQIAGISFINLNRISLLGGIFIVLSVVLLVIRYYHLKTKAITYGPTWGCGYTAGNEKQQYTAGSYAENYSSLANPVLQIHKEYIKIEEEDIFPSKRTYESHHQDFFRHSMIEKPLNFIMKALKKIAVMQTGQIQHYMLYAFLFLLLVFILTYFNLI
jgi:formate hydrogenlyase subunit 3/multisubunit Na+/H+ antiporter MnhD subunit